MSNEKCLDVETLMKMTESYAISVERLVAAYNVLYGWGKNTDTTDPELDTQEKKRLIKQKSQYFGNAYRTMSVLESMSNALAIEWSKYDEAASEEGEANAES